MKSIYVMECNGYYKLGMSKAPKKRLEQLQTGSNEKLKLIYSSEKLSNCSYIEASLHNYFKKCNICGEWFKFDDINKIIDTINAFVIENGNTRAPSKNKRIALEYYKKEIEKLREKYNSFANERIKCERENKYVEDFIRSLLLGNDSLYNDLIYRAIFGKPFKELQKEFGIKPKESLRDYLTGEQLKEVEQMEMLVSSLIGIGMGYNEIKGFIEERYTSCMLLVG